MSWAAEGENMKANHKLIRILAASRERRIRNLARRLGCDANTLKAGLERMATEVWPPRVAKAK